MIDLRQAEIKSESSEAEMADRLSAQGIPWKFGEVRLPNGARQPSTFLINDRYAVSFSPYEMGIESSLRENKFKPQHWSRADLWQQRELSRQLSLHG